MTLARFVLRKFIIFHCLSTFNLRKSIVFLAAVASSGLFVFSLTYTSHILSQSLFKINDKTLSYQDSLVILYTRQLLL